MRTRSIARIHVVIVAFALLCSIVYIPAGSTVSAAATTLYVDAGNGDDASGDGSSDHPWKTIGKAAAMAQAGDTVKIRSGTYRETVTPVNSGAPGAPITYEADTGADVKISGADLVTGPWAIHSGHIYKTTATLSMGDWKNQVFVDGVSMNLARWPNSGSDPLNQTYMNSDDGTDNSKILDADLSQPDGYWDGAGVVISDKYRWSIASTTVTSYTTGRLNLGSISTFGLAPNSPYYLIGKLAALDSGGEWFYDSGSTTLYLQTPASDNPANHVVEVKARSLSFDLAGKNDIHIKGIKMFASTLSTNSSHDIDIDGIDAKYPTHYELDQAAGDQFYGIQLGGTHNVLHNSTLAYSPCNLVTMDGENNQVVNNLMHDAAYGPVYGTSQSNIELNGRNNLISNNTLYNSGRSVIAGKPHNARIQYNYAYNAMTLTDDGGFMYFSNIDAEGTEIHHNVLHGANSSSLDGGIYLDFAVFDMKVFDNVVSDVNLFGVFFHSYTLFTEAYNNTFYNNSIFKMKDDGGATDAYGTRVINNIAYDSVAIAPTFGVVERHNFKAGDPLFADAAGGNFRLQSTSTAIDAGEVIEGVTDGYAGSAPDIGAYESGGPDWKAGHQFASPPAPVFTTTNLRYHTLLKNGFFERPIDPSDGWTKTFSQTAAIEVSGNTATSSRYSWTHGLKLGSGEDGVEQTVTGLKPNTEYELRGFGKAATSGQNIRIGVKNYGGAEKFEEVTATSWTKKKIRFTTGASDTAATVYVYKPTTGGFAFADDVTLMEVDPNAPAEVDLGSDPGQTDAGTTVVNDRDIGTGLNQYEFVGNWLQGPNIHAYKGDASFSMTANDYYQVRFEGTQVKLYSEKGSVMGIVGVSIDGGPETLIDLYSPDSEAQALVFTSPELNLGEHVLKVRVTGTQNAAGGGTWHVADKVEVIKPPVKVINDRDIGNGLNQYEFVGNWLQGPNIHAYKGDASFSMTANDYYQVRFEGKQIKLYSEKGSVMGIVGVSIDGGMETMIDMYAPESEAQALVYTSPELGTGTHILKVRVTGTQNAAGAGTWHVADKAEILLGAGTNPDPDPNPGPELVDLFTEDFENTAAAAIPEGWTQSTIHPVGVTVDAGGNHSLTLVEPGNDGVGTGASASFDPIHDKARVKLRVMAEQTGRTNNFLTLTDSNGVKVLEVLFDLDWDHSGLHNIARRTPDGNWSNLLEYNANQWYDVEVDVDLNSGVYGIKIDGADVVADVPLLHAASEIAHYATSTYGWDQGSFHVDNIRIAGPKKETQKVAVTDIAVAGDNGVSTIASLGGTLQMIASVTPDNATDKSVDWTVVAENGEATSAATIDVHGLLTTKADGKVKVVATAKDGSGVRGESVVTVDSTPPTIATPSKLTFLQTEPVLVNFSATDNISGLKPLEVTFNGQTSAGPISLDPLALHVGTYPIVVTATDNVGHQSTALFNLVITIDIGHLDELIAFGFDQGWIDNGGTKSSLMSHVNQIQQDQDNEKKLQNSINSMENKLRAQVGKQVQEQLADIILEDLALIQNSIGS